MDIKKSLSIFLALFFFFQCPLLRADTAQDHEALRALRTKATDAINTNNFNAMTPLLDKSFTVITLDNQKFNNAKDFQTYWQGLFTGHGAVLKKIEINPVADALTEFLSPTVGISYGVSNDTFYFNDGDVRKMQTRWTAVVRKGADGWKIVAIHFSANMFHNPVLTAMKARSYWFGAGGIILGIIIGVLIMLGCRCCKKSA